MDASFFIGALITGIVGSAHCIGMCGPLALAVHQAQHRSISSMLFYFLGKNITYIALGMVAGALGAGFIQVGWAQGLSIATGVALVFVGLNQLIRPSFWHKSKFAGLFQQSVAGLSGRVIQRGGVFSPLLLGLLNGLLPCGLVYLGIIGSAATGAVLGGGAYMALLGLGTIPGMLLFVLGVNAATMPVRIAIQRALPVVIVLVGLLLVLRGSGLGIPFISPAFENTANAPAVSCH